VAVALTEEISLGLPRATAVAAEVLAAGFGGVIVFRRRAPAQVLAAQAAIASGYVLVGLPVFMLGPAALVTLYTVGSRLPRARGVVVTAGAVAVMGLLLWTGASFPGLSSFVLFGALFGVAWFLGDVVQRWRLLAERTSAAPLNSSKRGKRWRGWLSPASGSGSRGSCTTWWRTA
jgi:hypothetical protein